MEGIIWPTSVSQVQLLADLALVNGTGTHDDDHLRRDGSKEGIHEVFAFTRTTHQVDSLDTPPKKAWGIARIQSRAMQTTMFYF